MILLADREREEGKINGGVGEKGENNRTAAQDVATWQVKLHRRLLPSQCKPVSGVCGKAVADGNIG